MRFPPQLAGDSKSPPAPGALGLQPPKVMIPAGSGPCPDCHREEGQGDRGQPLEQQAGRGVRALLGSASSSATGLQPCGARPRDAGGFLAACHGVGPGAPGGRAGGSATERGCWQTQDPEQQLSPGCSAWAPSARSLWNSRGRGLRPCEPTLALAAEHSTGPVLPSWAGRALGIGPGQPAGGVASKNTGRGVLGWSWDEVTHARVCLAGLGGHSWCLESR